jgi:hypothetical protein
MAVQTLNLIIPQGTTLERPFVQRHQLVLARDLIPNTTTPPTSIKIRAMSIDLPSGQVLTFPDPAGGCDDVELITTSITTAGSTTAAIQAYTGTKSLKCASKAPTLPRNITGQVWSGAAKSDYRSSEKILQFSFTLDPLIGLTTMIATSAATASLASNCRYDQLPVEKDWQNNAAFDTKILAAAYYWDAEYEWAGKVTRALQGRLFVPAEATT